jgi:hypothetical protein
LYGDRPRALAEGLVDAVEVEPAGAVLQPCRHLDDGPVDDLRNLEERHVRGRRENDRRPFGRVVLDRQLDALEHVGQEVHAGRIDLPAVRRLLPVRYGLRQAGVPIRGRIAELLPGHRVLDRRPDRRRGGKVHLGDPEGQHVGAELGPFEAAAPA